MNNIIAAVPFGVKTGGELFESKNAGFHQVRGTLKSLSIRTADNGQGMTEVDAIFSGVAHLLKIHNDMKATKIDTGYAEEHWRKVMVIYVLSKYRAYNIDVDVISQKDCSPLAWNIFGQRIADETEMKDGVYILRFSGKDAAIFDKKGFLLPLAEFSRNVEEDLGVNCIDGLLDYERNVMWTFLSGLAEKMFEYQCYVSNFIKDLEKYGAKNIDNQETVKVFEGIFKNDRFFADSRAWNDFHDIPALSVELPEVFQPKLVLAMTEMQDKSIVGFGKTFTFQFSIKINEAPYYFSGFLPLTEKIVSYLEGNGKKIMLQSVEADASEFFTEKKININLLFDVCGKKIALGKCYRKENIQYADSVPLLTIFPYVDLPKGYWKRYYLVLKRSDNKLGRNVDFLKNFDVIPGEELDMTYDDFYRSTKAEKEDHKEEWYYSVKDELPTFVKICRADFSQADRERNFSKAENYIGCIYAGKPEISQDSCTNIYLWALDMGTRNTIAAFRDMNGKEISFRLSREQLYCTLFSRMGKVNRDFARRCYAPNEEVYESFSTMVRVYKEGMENGGQICYEDGCALFPDVELIDEFIEGSRNWEKAAILTDIKFGRQDSVHEKALQIFLYNMLWLGCLECVLNGAGKIEVYISYPRSEVKKRIEDIWGVVLNQIKEVTNVHIQKNICYCSEAEANAKYLQKVMREHPDKKINPKSIFGICDIGDGTSDFNLYLGDADADKLPGRIQFSMRYAGGDILIDTIMRFGESPMDFRKLWNIQSNNTKQDKKNESAKKLIEKYCELTGEDRDRFKENRRNIVLTLIENVGLKDNLPTDPESSLRDFAAVLRFKYWNLFHVYGEMLRIFKPSEVLTFKLYMYGGGRKALKDATGKSLDDFATTDFGKDIIACLSEQVNVRTQSFYIDLGVENSQKTEVVEGMLTDNGQNTMRSMPYNGREEVDEFYKNERSGILPGTEINRDRIDELVIGYQQYIQCIKGKKYFNLDSKGDIENIYQAVSVGDSNRSDASLEYDNYVFFIQSVEALWYEVSRDGDNPSCLWEALLYSRISNELLNKNIL